MTRSAPAVHRTIVVVDVEGFGDRRRTNPHQVAVRDGVYRVLRTALARAGVPWSSCDHEDRGDGVFVLVPADISKSRFVDVLPHALAEALRAHNDGHGPQRRIRLRLALHAGEVVYDEHGVTGASVTLAFRLADAPPLKAALANSSGPLAVIVSPWFFDEVVRHSVNTDPGAYRAVRVTVKEAAMTGWIHLPGDPANPASASARPTDPGRPVPRQLPPAVRDFTGRDAELSELDALVPAEHPDPVSAMVIAAIDGAPGVGKTSLAVQWAHRAQRHFPDGTLFANLRGHGPSAPLRPGLVLVSVLHALGVPDERIPADLDTRVGMYRSLLAGRRVLVVLDNAANPKQVRPLLPGVPGCMVLVTSRTRLTGLVVAEAAHQVTLGLFDETEATALVRRIVGVDRAAAEPDAVGHLVAACARLPLALRVAASQIAARRPASVADMVADIVKGITEGPDRLAVLSGTGDDHSAVRTVFDWSYTRLLPEHGRTFRRIGLHPGTEFGVPAVGALTGLDDRAVHRHLEVLADRHLVTSIGHRRYRVHDLLHAYAGRRAELDDTPDARRDALVAVLTWYASAARTADRLIFPGLTRVEVELDPSGGEIPLAGRGPALGWMTAERANLMSALRAAASHGLPDVAACLAGSARFLSLGHRASSVVRLEAETLGITAVRAAGDPAMEAFLLAFRGDTLVDLDRLDEAEADFQRTFELAEELDDPVRRRAALVGLGMVRLRQHRYQESREYYEKALALSGQLGGRAEAVVRCNLSRISVQLGQYGAALGHAERELALRREAGDRVGEAYALGNAAAAWQGLGDHRKALGLAERAIAGYRDLDGTEQYLGTALEVAATSLEHTGDLATAMRHLREASAIATRLGDQGAEALWDRLQELETRAADGSAPRPATGRTARHR